MTSLDYLAALPGYCINMDRSPLRWTRTQEVMGPRLAALTRVPAPDGRTLPAAQVEEFALRGSSVADLVRELRISQRSKDDYWRGSLGCYLGHISAIKAGLSDGHETFIVLEDDCTPRLDLMKLTSPPPTLLGDGVYVWGGALVGGSYTAHARRAREASENPWSLIEPVPARVRNRYQTHAIQFDRRAAEVWLKTVEDHPHAYDYSWWFAMMEVTTYVPRTEIIYQELALGSERSSHVDRIRRAAAVKMAAEEEAFL